MKFRLSCAALAISAVLSGPAAAADLGGNCCADLEERIAELEATTARKGNRKVSLTVSGWVNEQMLFWDDGRESNVYVGNNDQERSRFKFSGKAKIDNDWSAGYVIEIGVRTSRSSRYSQLSDEGTDLGLDVRKASWFIESKTYGKLTLGHDGSATYHLLDDTDITNTRYYADAESITTIGIPGFLLRSNGVAFGVTWGNILSPGATQTPSNGERPDIIKYDSPQFAGFSVAAAWGEDDLWDVALIYKGEVGDFALAGRVGYAAYTDEHGGTGSGHCVRLFGVNREDCSEFGASGTVMHKPTGLYVYGAYGLKQDELRGWHYNAAGRNVEVDNQDITYYIQVGIEQKWTPLGKTTLFGSYREDDIGSVRANGIPAFDGVGGRVMVGSTIETWSGGVVQNIENAAMDLYLIYSHVEGEIDAANAATGVRSKIDLDDLDLVQAGARIQF